MRWGLLFLCLSGCQLFQTLGSDKLAVLVWMKQPKIDVAPFNALPTNGAVVTTAYFFTMKPEPKPQGGAFAAFFGAGKRVEMPEVGEGLYLQSSLVDDRLVYDTDENRRYGWKACLDYAEGCLGAEFTLKSVRAAPLVEKASLTISPELNPSGLPGFDGVLRTGSDFTVTFPAPAEGQGYRPLVIVYAVTGGGTPTQVFTSIPSDAPGLIQWILTEPELSYTIPGSALNTPGLYAVFVASARINTDTENLFLGSGAVAGDSSVYLLEVTGDAKSSNQGGLQIPGLPSIPLP